MVQATSYVVLACVCVCFFYAVGMFILSRMFCFALVLGTIDCVLLWGFCGEWWALRANLHANCFRFLPYWRWLRVHNPFFVAPQNLSDTRNSQVFFFFFLRWGCSFAKRLIAFWESEKENMTEYN